MSFSDQWVRGFMAHDKNFDSARFDGNNFLPSLFTLGSLWQAFNPDLSGFLIHGGKLIYWNGTMDTSVTPRDASRFYDGAVQTMGQKNTDKVLETFLLPGVGHCGGGPGPSDVDWLDAVTKWVEQGTPPSQQRLVAKKADANTIQDRPVCKYPSYPRYNGSGDPKRASSFVCSGG
jgi:feruloyl esterase